MKTIKQDELFQNLNSFLKSKGIELTEGSYAQRIQQGCNLLSDAINATQKTVKNAKGKVDQKLEQLRQSIHQATAPKPPRAPAQKQTKPRRTKPTARKPGHRQK